jgi:two-component system cell cycle sensor histidine kinase/response regulator CckA
MGDGSRDLEREVERLRQKCEALTLELEEAQHYRRAVEGSPLPTMCVCGSKGRYVFVNEAFAKMIDRPLEAVRAADPFEIFAASAHPDDFEMERATIGRVARGEIDSYTLDKRLVVNQEERQYRLDAFATRDAQGRLEYITGFFTDVEAAKALENAQERFDKELREAQRLGTIGKLAGGIAHDFNNRLVIIMGYSELLKRELPPGSPLAEHADLVLASAMRAAELTQQLLAYSRRQVLNPSAFDLSEMAFRMRRVLEAILGERIELSTELGAKRYVLADPGQIEQVVLNLAINARDAMPGGGRIVIETSDVILKAGVHADLPEGNYVVLVVSDTGSGIPDAVLPHIFEPFFTTKEMGHGTGLGLSMVEGIVHQSGGAIRVDTAQGKGTTFTIHLPCARGSEAPARAVPESMPLKSGHCETVLVCDDDDDVRELLTRVLGLRAYSVLSARSAREALELVRRQEGKVHLLVTDVAMPEMGGIELAAEVRKAHPSLAVLYISGYTENAALLSAPLGPSTYFLAKPFLPGDLTSLVSSILERPAQSPGPT